MNNLSKNQEAKKKVLKLISQLKVAYDRELRYRLESEFPHDITGKAIKALEREGKIKRTGVPGRRGAGDMPNVFYRMPSSEYRSLVPIMRRKLDLSILIAGVSREMGRHAELAWWRSFKRNGWEVYPEREEEVGRGIKEWDGRVTSLQNDIDFVAVKEGIAYGVEVKNGLNYPDDLYWKVRVASELDLVPLIVARWLNPAQVPMLPKVGAFYVVYKKSMYSTSYAPIISEINELLGLPIEARDEVEDDFFVKNVEPIHRKVIERMDEVEIKRKEFLIRLAYDYKVRRGLGDRKAER